MSHEYKSFSIEFYVLFESRWQPGIEKFKKALENDYFEYQYDDVKVVSFDTEVEYHVTFTEVDWTTVSERASFLDRFAEQTGGTAYHSFIYW